MNLLNTTEKVADAYGIAAEKLGMGVAIAVPLNAGPRPTYELSQEGLRREIKHRKETGPQTTAGSVLGGAAGGILGGTAGGAVGMAASAGPLKKLHEAESEAFKTRHNVNVEKMHARHEEGVRAMHERHDAFRQQVHQDFDNFRNGGRGGARPGAGGGGRPAIDMHSSPGGRSFKPSADRLRGMAGASSSAERAAAEAFTAHGGEQAARSIGRRAGGGLLAGTVLGVGGGVLAGKAIAKRMHNKRLEDLEAEAARAKHAEVDEIYKAAGFNKESANLAAVGQAATGAWNAAKAGVSQVGTAVRRAGTAAQLPARAAGAGATLGQKAQAVGGQFANAAGRFAQNRPGAALGVAAGTAALGTAGAGAVAGRMTAPRQ